MRTTQLSSGRVMTTVITRHHLGGVELAGLLCRFADAYRPDVWADESAGLDMTHAQVEECRGSG